MNKLLVILFFISWLSACATTESIYIPDDLKTSEETQVNSKEIIREIEGMIDNEN